MGRRQANGRGTICIVAGVIERDEARRRAEAHLREIESKSTSPLVLTGETEFADGWVFFYDSARHLETRALADSLAGNAPILVDRDTGDTFPTGTAHPVEYYLNQFSERKRCLREGWPLELDARFRHLLRLVNEGSGRRDARALDMYINARFEPRADHHVRDELLELERRGLVTKLPDSTGGVGNFWQITPAGLNALEAPDA